MQFPDSVLAHFAQADPQLHAAIVTHQLSCREIQPVTDPSRFFLELAESIVSQQLAVKAADAIWNRLLELMPRGEVTPEAILALPEQQLRDVGLSWAKVRYVRDLAEQTQAGNLAYQKISEFENEAVITELTKVKGIGRWTVEMFLIFTLGRPDVFSFGDLGLLRGFQKLYGVADEATARQQMPAVAELWAPYRSYGALALWAYYDKTKTA